MDAIYKLVIGLFDLSGLNALLLIGLIWMVHRRIHEMITDLHWAKKQLREHENTFLKYDMEVTRERRKDD